MSRQKAISKCPNCGALIHPGDAVYPFGGKEYCAKAECYQAVMKLVHENTIRVAAAKAAAVAEKKKDA